MFCFQPICWGYETAPRISDREIVERLTKLEEGQKAILREMDKRFEAMEKRFEAMDKRFEAMDKRFESIEKRFESTDKRFESLDSRFESLDSHFDQLINIMIAIICAFAGIVAVTIGFAIWDRRTMIRPFETKVREMEKRFEILESDDHSIDGDKLNRLIGAMKKLASGSPEIAEALKSFKLL